MNALRVINSNEQYIGPRCSPSPPSRFESIVTSDSRFSTSRYFTRQYLGWGLAVIKRFTLFGMLSAKVILATILDVSQADPFRQAMQFAEMIIKPQGGISFFPRHSWPVNQYRRPTLIHSRMQEAFVPTGMPSFQPNEGGRLGSIHITYHFKRSKAPSPLHTQYAQTAHSTTMTPFCGLEFGSTPVLFHFSVVTSTTPCPSKGIHIFG